MHVVVALHSRSVTTLKHKGVIGKLINTKNDPQITELNLWLNKIGDEGAKALTPSSPI